MLTGRVLIQLEQEYRRVAPRGATITEFVSVFLRVLDYPLSHQLYLSSALTELFLDIKERTQEELIKWEEVTSFFVESLKEDPNF